MSEVTFHPLANLFPMMEGVAFDELAADIRSNGQREDIVTLDGMILDGRNRYRGCLAAGVRPRFRDFDSRDGDDPLAFVVSKNLKRRHLNESQRAMVAARLVTMRQGERTDLQPSATLPKVAQPQAAALMNVSERLLRSAKTVQENGAPVLVRAVEQGRLTVTEGAIAARLDPLRQEKIAAAAEAGQKSATRTIVKRSAREAREAVLGAAQAHKNLELPQKRYGVIVADPEWRFEPWSRATGMDRAADNHYPTSCVDVIATRGFDCRGRLRAISLGDSANARGSVLRAGCLGLRAVRAQSSERRSNSGQTEGSLCFIRRMGEIPTGHRNRHGTLVPRRS